MSSNSQKPKIYIDNSEQGHKREYLEKIRRKRRALGYVVAFLWIIGISYRLCYIQVLNKERKFEKLGESQYEKKILIQSERGNIYDTNEEIMASSRFAPAVYAHPLKIQKDGKEKLEKLAKKLSKILSIDEDEILEKLNKNVTFVYLKKHVSKEEFKKIKKLGDKNKVWYERDFLRVYPYKSSISTLLGKVGTGERGLSGLEAVFDKKLKGEAIKEVISKDALGKTIKTNEVDVYKVPQGQDIYLTIDADIQVIVDEQIKKARKNLHAKAVMATMINAYNGDIIAMSQSPSVNFNKASVENPNELKNLVIETVFEPGSIFKPIVAGIAFEQGLVRENEMFDCEMGHYRYSNAIIKDAHPLGMLSFREVVIKSSNIGMTKIADRLGKEKLWTGLSNYGIGKIVDLGFPGQTPGIFRNYKNWAKVDVATHSFGQGVAVTSLQVLRAIASFANGGYLPTLRILKLNNEVAPQRVVSENTANVMKSILVDTVEQGTGKQAKVEGYIVGGKTGTAQKAKKNGRGYEQGKYIASFIGFVDTTNNPVYVGKKEFLPLLIVNVDEAHSTSIYGGTLAGPVFRKIMKKTMSLLEKRKLLN